MRFKQEILIAIKYFLGATVITLAILSIWPWYVKRLEHLDAAKSLPSIKAAGEGIKSYEEEWDKLPPPSDWVNSVKNYTKITQDPTYLALTKEDQPDNPGWGMNSRINLSIGKGERLPKSVSSSDFPSDSVLLGPSYEQAIFPQRNGDLPLQRLSKTNSIPTQHGLRLGSTKDHLGVSSLYLLNDGSVKQLGLEKAAELLKIRPLPPSEKALVEKNIAYSEDVQWEPKKGVEVFPKYIILKRGDALTPLIPLKEKDTTISFETSSSAPTEFALSVEYFNEYKFPVNVKTKDGKLLYEARLTSIYSGTRDLWTDKPISAEKGTLIAFNPSFGFADPIVKAKGSSREKNGRWFTQIEKTEANFAPNTVVTRTTDIRQHFKQQSSESWKETKVKLPKNIVPEWAKYVALRLENNSSIPLTIRSVKVSNK